MVILFCGLSNDIVQNKKHISAIMENSLLPKNLFKVGKTTLEEC